VLDRRLVEDVANKLRPGGEGLIEKDWHVVRAISVLANLDQGDVRSVFSGGTSLSMAWGLIKRFSEDVDFKVAMLEAPSPSQARVRRSAHKQQVLDAVSGAGFQLIGRPYSRNESSFFSADFAYPSEFEPTPGLRPHLRIEMIYQAPALPAVARPIRSLIAQAQGREAEVPAFPCVDPAETAADKLSALAWRVCVRERGSHRDDPAVIRHLHDLAALETHVAATPAFTALLVKAVNDDTGRGGGQAPTNPLERIARMLERLATDPLWAQEYDQYVQNVSFAARDETISFADALMATTRLTALFTHAERFQCPTARRA
jgi:hypothetical protein